MKTFWTGSIMALAAASSPVAAQTDDLALAEIVVTAQKRAESLQSVPIAVTAFTGETLRELGISNSMDLAAFTPGLNMGDPLGQGNQPAIFLRGVGLNDFNTNNSSPVGVYVDDIYISAVSAQNFLLFDLEQVEVLKGPQGTLYGRNTTGGAIKFTSAQPSDEFTAKARLSYGRFDALEAEAAISGPLADGIKFRLAGTRMRSDGFVKNLVDGETYNEDDSYAWRATFLIEPSEDLDLTLQAFGGEITPKAPLYQHFGTMDPASFDEELQAFTARCSAAAIRALACVDQIGYQDASGDRYASESDRGGRLKVETLGFSGTLNWRATDSVTITSVTSYIDVEKLHEEDTDSGPVDFLHVTYGVDQWTFTQELRAAGSGSNHNWLVGLYYLEETVDQDQSANIFQSYRDELLDLGVDPMDIINAFLIYTHHMNKQKTKSYAAFGQVDYNITDQLNATLGLRYTKEKRSFLTQVDLVEPLLIPGGIIDGMGNAYSEKIDNDELSFRVGLNYSFNEDVMVYANVSTAFKSGGFNGSFIFDPAELEYLSYEPETITAYHLGFKSDLAGRRLRVNGELFYYDYDDLQVFTLVDLGGPLPASVLANAASARMKGAELEVTALPLQGLTLQGAVSYLDATLRDFQSVAGDFSGNRPALSPKWSFSVRAAYEHPITDTLSVRLQSDVNWQDDVYYNVDNVEETRQSAYAIWNARLSLLSSNGQWEVAGWVRNIADKNYWSYLIDIGESFGMIQGMRGMPRTYGLELSVQY